MKANRKFKEADERAVSAVIGVILMVAITVAIAATVYVYVSGMIGGGAEKAPDMAFNKQTSGTKGVTLVSADSGLDWSEFTVTGATQPTGAVTAGQFITLTNQTAGTITIVHDATNTLIGSWIWA